MIKDKVLMVRVDVYVNVPHNTSKVAIEGTVAEGLEHGVVFLLGDYALEGRIGTTVWAAQSIDPGEVPTRITAEWDEMEDLALAPKQP